MKHHSAVDSSETPKCHPNSHYRPLIFTAKENFQGLGLEKGKRYNSGRIAICAECMEKKRNA